ncbi:MAG: hypothetical protein HY698_14395 [Deltaproteobacteria bacterium]|nr:hypothetical protein [Deltaproteobacteria bacterium]
MNAKWGFLLLLGILGCDRPSEEECARAIANINKITAFESQAQGKDAAAAVRSCRSQGTKAAVQCWIRATSVEDLAKCEGSPVAGSK